MRKTLSYSNDPVYFVSNFEKKELMDYLNRNSEVFLRSFLDISTLYKELLEYTYFSRPKSTNCYLNKLGKHFYFMRNSIKYPSKYNLKNCLLEAALLKYKLEL